MSWWLGFSYPKQLPGVNVSALNVVARPRLAQEPEGRGWPWYSVWSSAGSRAEAREAVREALGLVSGLLIWSYGAERPPWELFPADVQPQGGPQEAWPGSRPASEVEPEPSAWWLVWQSAAPLASPPGRPPWLEALGWSGDGDAYQARVLAVDLAAAQGLVISAFGRPVRWLWGRQRPPASWPEVAADGWRLQWGLPTPPAGSPPAEVSQLVLRGFGPFRGARGLVSAHRFEAVVTAGSAPEAWALLERWNPRLHRGTCEPWLLPRVPVAGPAPAVEPAVRGLMWRLRCGLWACTETPTVPPGVLIHARGQGKFREASGETQHGVWCFDLDVPAKTEAEAWGVARATLGPGMLQGLGMRLARSRASRHRISDRRRR